MRWSIAEIGEKAILSMARGYTTLYVVSVTLGIEISSQPSWLVTCEVWAVSSNAWRRYDKLPVCLYIFIVLHHAPLFRHHARYQKSFSNQQHLDIMYTWSQIWLIHKPTRRSKLNWNKSQNPQYPKYLSSCWAGLMKCIITILFPHAYQIWCVYVKLYTRHKTQWHMVALQSHWTALVTHTYVCAKFHFHFSFQPKCWTLTNYPAKIAQQSVQPNQKMNEWI